MIDFTKGDKDSGKKNDGKPFALKRNFPFSLLNQKNKQPKIVKFNEANENATPQTSNTPQKTFTREEIVKQQQALPIFPVKQQLVEEIKKHSTSIVIGETGSGKTTQIPQFILKSGLAQQGIIGVTQPRRVAAITIATRVAEELGTELGQRVGYTVRFEDVTSPSTKIKFLTDGMLMREAMLDPLLTRYSVILLDEAHERTIHTDVLFSVVKKAQRERQTSGKNSLKIIVMSATMDVDHFSQYFNKAPVLYLEGRQFPIEMRQAKEPQDDYLFASLVTLFQIHKEAPADHHILVFLTGQEEIEAVAKSAKLVAKDMGGNYPPLKVCPLFASLPSHQQLEAFQQPPAGTRKVVLSTNIAETSVTIDGIRFVIDCGKVKARTHIPATGMDILKVQRISQAQAWQRAGRAGRQAAGTCYRTYTLQEFESMPRNSVPEIQRCSLTTVMLQLVALGIDDPLNFDFMDKPPMDLMVSALRELHLLGAISSVERPCLTDTGKQMAAFPLDPRFTKVILAAQENDCTEEVISIVALLSADSILVSPSHQREEALAARDKFASSEGDHITLLNILRAFNAAKQSRQWCYENFVNYRGLCYAVQVKKQLLELCDRMGIPIKSCRPQTVPVRKSLIAGLFLSVAELQREGNYITLGSRQSVSIHPSSVLFRSRPQCIVFTELVQTGKRYVRQVTLIDPDWLGELPQEALQKYRQNVRQSAKGH